MGLFHRKRAKDSTPAAQTAPEKSAATAEPAPPVQQPLTPEERAVKLGKDGEDEIVKALESLSIKGEIFRNLYVPQGKSERSEIDVLFLTNKALYVIESKNYSGWIYEREGDRDWLETFSSTDKYEFTNPVWQNEIHCDSIRKWYEECLKQPLKMPIISVIVFGERCELKRILSSPERAFITQTPKLKDVISKSYSSLQSEVSAEERGTVFNLLSKLDAQKGEFVKDLHIEQIKSKHLKCPICGGKLVERKNGKTGEPFYGCSNYPDCKFTRKIP